MTMLRNNTSSITELPSHPYLGVNQNHRSLLGINPVDCYLSCDVRTNVGNVVVFYVTRYTLHVHMIQNTLDFVRTSKWFRVCWESFVLVGGLGCVGVIRTSRWC